MKAQAGQAEQAEQVEQEEEDQDRQELDAEYQRSNEEACSAQ